MSAEEYKTLGNKAFSAHDYKTAIEQFTKAIELDSKNHVLYSNRSAAYASLKDYSKALEDANKTVELKNDWAKGYSRKGAALHGLNRLEEALETYQAGLKIEPNNEQLKKSLTEVESVLASSNPFNNLIPRIAAHPSLKKYLEEPDFLPKIQAIQRDPKLLSMYLQDPRIGDVLKHILGINFGFGDREMDIFDNLPEQNNEPKETPKTESEPEPEIITESTEEQMKKKEADKEKEFGNEAYKKREFDEALKHYDKAWELDPTNVTILTNKAAVLFEQEKYEECINICKEAIEVGREHRADYKLVARAYGRIGNACVKLDKFDDAIKYYNKSLTEHRTPDILKKLNEIEKLRVKREKEAYYNPELSDQARERGNELFKKNDFAGAVKEYTEAIKRNEKDPRAYSNRAACYTKLMAFQEALKDCETCISFDPTFVKAYIRKAAVEFLKKEYGKCLETCELARQHDIEKKHATEILQQIRKCHESMGQSESSQEEVMAKARNDPEIQRILHDPVMSQILSQAQEDPRALMEHMKNPEVANNIRKLMNAGILKLA
ncbi:299_t:CDS:10 [Ambispora gerdemannii]|uniref:299_t:CDS:1 n=1 Tax=Ambispora gerdemannii TaxID=144530 RepID=A0A9N9EYH0_9GLOM|nr:299_t:CDS:10 [Ambispora gerdemannii]